MNTFYLAAGHNDGLVGGLASHQGVDQVLLHVTDLKGRKRQRE